MPEEPAAAGRSRGRGQRYDGTDRQCRGRLLAVLRGSDTAVTHADFDVVWADRAQLARYAEALEEDLASGREKVAARTREGLAFEKAFSEVSVLLLNHLKAKPEARDLLQDLMANMHGQPGYAAMPTSNPNKPSDSRRP